jgi:uroporphyrinogen decarboxylase
VAALKKENVVVCNSYIPGVYEHIKRFLGDENALVGMYEFPHRLRSSIERVADWLFKLNEIIATTGVDICWIGDDIGAQNSLIMSLENYREFYKPFHREQIIRIKKINQGIKVAFHCCGHIMPLVPELMDIGVDIIEAVQPEANNDLNILKSEYGSEIAFWGAIGMQSVFFSSTWEEVAEDVRSALRAMSRGGGYIAAPCHTVTSDVSSENVKTFYNTLKTYGMYPSPGDAP